MATQREIELCQEIIGLAIQVNIQGNYSLWVGYRGHINALDVQFGALWQEGVSSGQCRYFHLSGSGNIPSASLIRKPKDVIADLEGVKAEIAALLVADEVSA